MAPIPIYSKSPISAAKADGVTPKTESGADNNSRAGRYAPETPTKTTPLGAGAGGPPPPQPGAVPSLPQPTGSVQSPSYRGQYAPPPPAPTSAVGLSSRTSTNYTPPPPQPGAVPVPPSTAGTTASNYFRAGASPAPPTTTAAAVLPPPPRAGESLASTGILNAQTQTQTQTQTAQPTSTMSMPPQMGMAPLTASPYPSAARGTSTTTTQGAAYGGIPQPTGLAQGLAMGEQQEQQQVNLNHPPGYVQDPYAAEMTGSQRAAAAQVGTSGGGDGGLASYHSSSAFNSNRSTFDDGNGEGLWDAAKKFAASAGERLSAAETEVWRRINNQS